MDVVRKKQATTVRFDKLETGTHLHFGDVPHEAIVIDPVGGKPQAIMLEGPIAGKFGNPEPFSQVTPVNPIKQEPERVNLGNLREEPDWNHLFRVWANHDEWIGVDSDGGSRRLHDWHYQQFRNGTVVSRVEGTFVEKGAAFHQEEEG